MSWEFHPYTLALFLSSTVSVILAFGAWKKRPSSNPMSFVVMMLTVAVWSAVHIFEMGSTDINDKIYYANIQFLPIVIAPIAWLAFAMYYTKRLRLLTPHWLIWLSLIPLITVVLVWTNPFHGLVFTKAELVSLPPFTLLYRHFASWFWVHTAYCYILIFIGTFFLIRSLLNSPRLFNGQVIALLIGALAPWLGNIMYVFKISPFSDLDMTPFAFTISGIAFAWGIFRFRLLDIVPIAYDLMLNNMQDCVFIFDDNNRLTGLNPSALGFVNREKKEIMGLDSEQVLFGWKEMSRVPKDKPGKKILIINKNNKRKYYYATITPLNKKGRLIGRLMVLRDITKSKAAEMNLQKSRENLKSISDNAPLIICTLDATNKITYVNPAWHKILGHEKKAVIGRFFFDFVDIGLSKTAIGKFNSIKEQKKTIEDIPLTLLKKNGKKRYFNAGTAPNLNANGQFVGIICMLKDVTEERLLHAQLQQSQKMEAIGTLAGGVAHDFNNLLMGIQANISLIHLAVEGDNQTIDKLDRIEKQIQTGASLTRQLLGYARKGKYKVEQLNLNIVSKTVLDTFARTQKHLTIHCSPDDSLPAIEADQGQLELVLLNLFVNAADAMPNGGDLTITTKTCYHSHMKAKSYDIKSGLYVQLSIADNGTGMDQHTVSRIFEPFYTTKEMGRGTGLGLASVYGVVKSHNGYIDVDSKVGKGSVFNLYFPASSQEADMPAPKNGALLGGVGTILLVDDETDILESGAELLENLGYDVLKADDGKDALDLYSRNKDKIDLVILDVIMPKINGNDLFFRLRKIDGKLKFLFASGYSINDTTEHILKSGEHGFIKKPFTIEQLSEKINRLMATAPL